MGILLQTLPSIPTLTWSLIFGLMTQNLPLFLLLLGIFMVAIALIGHFFWKVLIIISVLLLIVGAILQFKLI